MAKDLKKITNLDVKKLITLKEELKSLDTRVEILKETIKDRELLFAKALRRGFDSSRLKWDLTIQTIQKRYPAWKEHFINAMGKTMADKILKKTKPISYTHIKIQKKLKITMED
jgi:hypothetical protein